MRPPCKRGGRDCPLRRAGCQSRCEAYRAFQQANDARYVKAEEDRRIREVLDVGFVMRARQHQRKLRAV